MNTIQYKINYGNIEECLHRVLAETIFSFFTFNKTFSLGVNYTIKQYTINYTWT